MQFFCVFSTFSSWPYGPRRVKQIFPTFEAAEKHAMTIGEDNTRASVWIEKLEISKTDLLFLLIQYNLEAMSSILDDAKDKFQVEKIQIK